MSLITRVLCVVMLATGGVASASDYLVYSGTGKALHGDEFLYGERHVLRFDQGKLAERVVLYTCRDGSAFARKRVYYRDPLAPDFELDDSATGYREGIRSDGSRRVVFFKAASDPERTAPVPTVDELVADAGFDEFVKKHWTELLSNAPARFDFLIPSTLGEHRFQVSHEGTDVIAGRVNEVFRLRLAGWWGVLLPSIDVRYDAKERVLTRYEGISNLRSARGGNLKAQIDFPVEARRPATDAALQSALAASLGKCHSPT